MLKDLSKKIIQLYLKYLTKFYLWRGKPEIILIAGTTNRFWIKEEVVSQLREKFGPEEVRTNPKNFNAEIGLPLAILNLPSGRGDLSAWPQILWQGAKMAFLDAQIPRYLVLDAAFSAPGDLSYIYSIIKPKIAIITNITPVYMENFRDLSHIGVELAEVAQNLPQNGYLILNNDDERVSAIKDTQAKIITFGINKNSDFTARDIQKTISGQKFNIVNDSQSKEVEINRFGQHHIYAKLVGHIIKTVYN